MFERFTDDARAAVVAAEEEAGALRHGWIGTEHLLLGVLCGGGDGTKLLAGFGVDAAGVRADVVQSIGRGDEGIDPDALATLGIDLDAVRERVERAFGRGALSRRGRCAGRTPFCPRAKKALELAFRESRALAAGEIRTEHLVLGLLRVDDGVAAQILAGRGVTLEAARSRVAGRDAA
jgi:ATP-dependent Clp protease ATP-binding subunit ClpA